MIRYMSAEDRREVLLTYGRVYGLQIFIETGTNTGDTPAALMHAFVDLYTIELDATLFNDANNRFVQQPNVHVIQGDSTHMLPLILQQINQPALVWLDGHHSGGATARGALDTPVVQELEALFADTRKHVILVDDARIFAGQPEHGDEPHYHDYPSCEWVQQMAVAHGYDYLLLDDIMRLTPHASD